MIGTNRNLAPPPQERCRLLPSPLLPRTGTDNSKICRQQNRRESDCRRKLADKLIARFGNGMAAIHRARERESLLRRLLLKEVSTGLVRGLTLAQLMSYALPCPPCSFTPVKMLLLVARPVAALSAPYPI